MKRNIAGKPAPSMTADPAEETSAVGLDVVMAATCYLVSRYALDPNPGLAAAVADHLGIIAVHPDCRSRTLSQAGHRLARLWRGIAAGARSRVRH